ncbi:MAG: S9 family peptidase [Candidatus Solibacter usitatus]|nr:S9 family peptidase [Candidatus Solibacter usitatus]
MRVILALTLISTALAAEEGYRKPSAAIAAVLNAPATPEASLSPAGDYLLLSQSVRNPPIADLARPMLRLAGQRIDPATNGRHSAQYFVSLSLLRLADGVETRISLPPGFRFAAPEWSPDGKHFVILHTRAGEIWAGDTQAAKVRRIAGGVNSAFGDAVRWMPDSRTLLVQLIPSGRGKPPERPSTPTGPNIQETAGKASPVWTFQDLLTSAYDEKLFEYYATAQLALVDSVTGHSTPVGAPAVFRKAAPSPDARFLFVERIVHPYSWLHPAQNFPTELEVWDRNGKLVHKVASLPLAEAPIEGVPTGPRQAGWKPTDPATLEWVEALDGGNPKNAATHRDRVLLLPAPFQAAPQELVRTEHRALSVQWLEGGDGALVSDFDRRRRWTRRLLVRSGQPPRVLSSRNQSDRYNDPGLPVTRLLANGHTAVRQHAGSIFLTGTGSSPEGDRPFLDRLDLESGKSERLFRSSATGYESVAGLSAPDGSRLVTRYESPGEPPNYFLRSSDRKALTHYPDPAPQLRQVRKELVRYKRADGVDLSFTLYLPPGYQSGARLPTVVWAYPREYTDAGVAGQVSGSTQRFTLPLGASHLYFLLAGYAILDDASLPVVGDPETVNNTYVEQIVAGAKAAIDKAVELGVTDRNRVGVGGHSYGAFMTANLLAHSELFRAGIARSGAHNRTLTPFGFQAERRTLWEAPEVYLRMSPLLSAHKINEPILFIHGEADNNSGTFPVQSERMYQAVRGNGGVARLVMLPHEAHGYAARESVEHVVAEMISWFDRHVKDAPPR